MDFWKEVLDLRVKSNLLNLLEEVKKVIPSTMSIIYFRKQLKIPIKK
jgi:hypothetical protein